MTQVCKKGYSCGATCISMKYKCRKDFELQAGETIDQVIKSELDKIKNSFLDAKKSKPEPKPEVKYPKDYNNKTQSESPFPNGNADDIAKALGVTGEKANQMSESLDFFTSGNWKQVHQYMNGKRQDDEELKNKVENLREFMDKAPKYEGAVYRGLQGIKGDDFFGGNTARALPEVGTTIESTSFQSWTKSSKVAESFSEKEVGIVLKLVNNKSGVDIQNFSQFQKEQEVLLPPNDRGNKLKVIKTYEKDGYRIAEVEEVFE